MGGYPVGVMAVIVLGSGCGRISFDARTDAGADTVDANPVACGDVPVTHVTTGRHFTCVILEGGAVQCWGTRFEGQTGNGAGDPQIEPQTVALPGPAISLDAGAFHACAALADGRVYCWGQNQNGQLGIGTTAVEARLPTEVVAIPAADEVIAGSRHSCMRARGTGDVYCWGENARNALGDGTVGSTDTAVQVMNLTGTIALSAGHHFNCAIRGDRTVACWGFNDHGSLGDGTTTARLVPVAVTGGVTNVQALMTGARFGCVLRTDGVPLCWGSNFNGQQGKDTNMIELQPTPMLASNVTHMAGGARHSCIATDVGVRCSGTNFRGQLGDTTLTARETPGAIVLEGPVDQLAGGWDHTCARVGGVVHCWGDNSDGELGAGTRAIRTAPVRVALSGAADFVVAGDKTVCARLTSGTLECWGAVPSNRSSTTPVAVPLPVSGAPGSLGIGFDHICAIQSDTARCIGQNYGGQLGNGTGVDSSSAVTPTGITTASWVAAQAFTSCAIESAEVQCWGGNMSGQLGDGTQTDRIAPVSTGILDAQQVATSSNHTCALRSGGAAMSCWGDNDQGQLGIGAPGASELSPVDTTTPWGTATRMALGGRHTCVLASDTTAWCWGRNSEGELGIGSQVDQSVGVQVPGATFTRIAAGENHTCGVDTDGVVWCWGWNGAGHLGDGTISLRTSPVAVVGLPPARDVTVGNGYSCALTSSDGEVWCWGVNHSGQLGDGLPPAHARAQQARVYCVP